MGNRPKFHFEVEAQFWRLLRSGLSPTEACAQMGRPRPWGHAVLRKAGGVNPTPINEPAGRYLSFAEREEIMRMNAAGHGVRHIARELERSASTISRELKRGLGYRTGYRASVGQHEADKGRRAPRTAKLATNLPLRREVQARLKRLDSPEQIAGRLKIDFPNNPEMRVSAETIYQSLYVQSRGGLKRELTKHLRTGRTIRKPHRSSDERRGKIPGMILIGARPADVEERDIPGHWEGDLILGSVASASAVGTLVERTSGFTMLLHLPGRHDAVAVQDALVAKIATLPEQLRLSLTWDQGKEMANHIQIAKATGMNVYFCDPHSPWQRGSNENTNGLLRQYLPKGSDLSLHGPGLLDNIAADLNARPRKRHDFRTPAEVLDELLSEASKKHGVA